MARPPVYRSRWSGRGDRGSDPYRKVNRPAYIIPTRSPDFRDINNRPWSDFGGGFPGLGYTPKGKAGAGPGNVVEPPDEDFVMPDYKDALYNQAIAQLTQEETNLKARALEGKKSALLRLGSRSLAEKILGTQEAALLGISDDPNASFSTLAKINRELGDLRLNINNVRNNEGLWFSSTRGTDLTNAAYGAQGARTAATQDAQDYMTGLSNDLQSALQDITWRRMGAEEEAMQRAIQLWMLGGGRKKKPPPGGGGGAPPQQPQPPGQPWPTDPIYNPLPGGKPYPI